MSVAVHGRQEEEERLGDNRISNLRKLKFFIKFIVVSGNLWDLFDVCGLLLLWRSSGWHSHAFEMSGRGGGEERGENVLFVPLLRLWDEDF